ncbi:MAG: efflux RND transporter permease subunit [Bdellovibrionota bacterium]
MSLADLSIKRPVFITSIVIIMITVGLLSLKKLGVDLFPDVTIPVLSVQTVYPGASPYDVESLVSKPLEDEMGSLPGLKLISSTNLESVSIVVVEFNYGTDIKDAEQQLRGRLTKVRNQLPTEIEEPIIRRIDPADQPIVRVAVSAKVDPAKLFDAADLMVRPELERVSGVGLVDVVGGRKREVHVTVDKDKLDRYELSMQQIAGRLGASSKNVPMGKISSGSQETIFRTLGEFNTLKSVSEVAVNFFGSDRAVRVRDIGTVTDGLEKEKTRAVVNGEPALFLDVYRQAGTNTANVADNVKARLANIEQLLHSKGIDAKLNVVRDGADQIRANVADVYETILIGIFLCIVVVFFFLGSLKSTLITGLALPNSLLGAFVLMYLMGFTVNMMTLLALTLAVGLLIDDAIVVRENIFRHMAMGKEPKKAAADGTNEVAMAVIAVTIVIMAVFGPISFLSGTVGQFFKQFGLTVVFAMAISLFDAMTVAPMLSAYWGGGHHGPGDGFVGKILKGFDVFQTKLEDLYEKALKWTILHPKTIITLAIVLFIGSVSLAKFIPKTFLPAAENGIFQVSLDAPPGTSLEKMAEIAGRVDEEVRKHPAVLLSALTVGTKDGEANKSSIFVQLKPFKQRTASTSQTKTDMRTGLAHFSGEAIVKVGDYDAFGGGQRPFTMNVSGTDLDELSKYVQETLLPEMKQIQGFVDVDTNYRTGKPEFQIVFDREHAEELGVSTVSAGAELRGRMEGLIPAVLRDQGNEYDIRVMFPDAEQDIRKEFKQTRVPNVNGNLVYLSRVAEGRDVLGYSQINRVNKARNIVISGDIGPTGALGDIINKTTDILAKNPPPAGVTTQFVGQAENFKELMESMVIAIGLGVLLIYLVIASLYESFITPFTILLALPMAVSGAFGSLLIFHKTIDIFSMIGFVMLMGVAAKNSILLVDYTLQLERDHDMNRFDALVKACRTRLRPILMTSLALIAGTIPLAVGLTEASSQRTSMGVAIIGGVVSSTLLTLLVVPAAYGFIDDFRKWSLKLAYRIAGQKQPVAAAKKNLPASEAEATISH